MPWDIKRDPRCSAEKPWGVVKRDGTLEGCHVSEDKAKAQQAALYANEPPARAADESQTYETRHVWTMDQIEMRETPGGGMHFSGYAAVFNQDSEPLPFIESILPGAFRRTLRNKREVRMFLNHNQDFVLGTTKSNLHLAEDDHGLLAEADFAPTSYALDLATNIRAKIVDKMSFGMTVPAKGDEWDGAHRYLREVNLFDVSPVTGFPAYSQTSAVIRSLAEGMGAEPDDLALAILVLTETTSLLTAEQAALLSSVIQTRRAKPKTDWTAEFASLRRDQQSLGAAARSL